MGSPALRFQSQGEKEESGRAVSKGHWEARTVSSHTEGNRSWAAREGDIFCLEKGHCG